MSDHLVYTLGYALILMYHYFIHFTAKDQILFYITVSHNKTVKAQRYESQPIFLKSRLSTATNTAEISYIYRSLV